MELGHVDTEDSKIILYGAAGAGKTSSMDLIIGNAAAVKRVSTGLATRPVTLFQIKMSDKNQWERLPLKKKKEILARVVYTMSLLDKKKASEAGDKSSSEEDNVSDGEEPRVAEASAVSTEAGPTETSEPHLIAVAFSKGRKTSEQRRSAATEQSRATCINLIELSLSCESSEVPLTSFRRIYVIDSGGQPQFHEILPIFLRGMNLYIYVTKLCEELCVKPMVEYYDSSGEAVCKPYR